MDQKVALSFGILWQPCGAAIFPRPHHPVKVLTREILIRQSRIARLIGQFAEECTISGSRGLAPPCYPWAGLCWESSRSKQGECQNPVGDVMSCSALRPRLVRGCRGCRYKWMQTPPPNRHHVVSGFGFVRVSHLCESLVLPLFWSSPNSSTTTKRAPPSGMGMKWKWE